ncbi:DUF4345 domain-containing protein [Pseudooceanicola sp.]|uniref:DUF4345 domain-containing protein n=1 Tax=Pseudooceanicola sp. TaxID=1914328 RepID=UPI0035C6EF21
MQSDYPILLRAILLLAGLGITFLGIDNAFGGMATLGWQGPTDFFQVTSERAFALRDSHIRFISGVWLAIGLVFCLAALRPDRLGEVIITLCGLIFIGGLLRFTQGDPGLLVSPDLIGSLLFELLLFPALGLWLYRIARKPPAA